MACVAEQFYNAIYANPSVSMPATTTDVVHEILIILV